MTDVTYYLLDALLGAAKGILINSRAKTISEERGTTEDPRSGVVRFATHPVTNAAYNLIGAYILNKGMQSSDVF